MKSKVLFIMHMPPPVHGAAMVGKYIHDSRLINETNVGKREKPVMRSIAKILP